MAKAKFPTSKPTVVVLAQAMIHGLTEARADFPAPPVLPADLQARLDAALAVTNERTTIEAALRAIVRREDAGYDDLEDDMKTDLKYAELTVKGDDAKLRQIGWSGRAAPSAKQAPNVPRALESIGQGKGWIHCDWKDSVGGNVNLYRVLMMEVGAGSDGGGEWKEVASAIESEAVVTGLATGKEYIFCVVAVNSAGASKQSNTVTAFL